MERFGSLIITLAVFSAVLTLLDRELVLMAWIQAWGEGAAWGIRIAMVIGGGALLNAGRKQHQRALAAQPQAAETPEG